MLMLSRQAAFRAIMVHHGDPFDRMLVAQAQVESLVILSNDRKLSHYDVDIHW
jgi:PIN domain nuclease of toxin-antitoxin system